MTPAVHSQLTYVYPHMIQAIGISVWIPASWECTAGATGSILHSPLKFLYPVVGSAGFIEPPLLSQLMISYLIATQELLKVHLLTLELELEATLAALARLLLVHSVVIIVGAVVACVGSLRVAPGGAPFAS